MAWHGDFWAACSKELLIRAKCGSSTTTTVMGTGEESKETLISTRGLRMAILVIKFNSGYYE